jgi:hypothetical protein
MTEGEAKMTAMLSFTLGALMGASLVYLFYRKVQGELAHLKEAARAKVDSVL